MTGRPLPPAWEDDDPMTPDDLARAEADAIEDAHYEALTRYLAGEYDPPQEDR